MTDPRHFLFRDPPEERKPGDKNDPYGFWDMSERELIDWMGAGYAEPGSVVYKHAEHVLALKQREAEERVRASERAQRSLDDFMDEMTGGGSSAERVEGTPGRTPDHLSQAHLALLALPFGVFAAVIVPTGSVLWGIFAAGASVGVLFIRQVRNWLVRWLSRIAD